MQIEHFFTCPYCWAHISVLLDPAAESQSYVEDCEVCCRPIAISWRLEEKQVVEFEAVPTD